MDAREWKMAHMLKQGKAVLEIYTRNLSHNNIDLWNNLMAELRVSKVLDYVKEDGQSIYIILIVKRLIVTTGQCYTTQAYDSKKNGQSLIGWKTKA
uniref:DUF4258 domain-containing protein n=1 Tax=Rhabditophanes sp. KR3021 TaxID=114890 RepID=A0AC35TSP9_9BILA